MSIPAGVGIGIAVGLMLSLLGTAFGAWLLITERVGEESAETLSWGILGVAAMCGAFISAKVVDTKKIPVALLTGMGYLLSLLSITALFFEGTYDNIMIPCLIIAVCCILAGILSVQHPKGRNTIHPKRPYR